MTENKKWYLSKTLWLNTLVAAGAVFLEAAPDGVEWVAILNIVMRIITKQGVTL